MLRALAACSLAPKRPAGRGRPRRSEPRGQPDDRPLVGHVPLEAAVLVVLVQHAVAGAHEGGTAEQLEAVADAGGPAPGEVRADAEAADVALGEGLPAIGELEPPAEADDRIGPGLGSGKYADVRATANAYCQGLGLGPVRKWKANACGEDESSYVRFNPGANAWEFRSSGSANNEFGLLPLSAPDLSSLRRPIRAEASQDQWVTAACSADLVALDTVHHNM